MKCAVIDIGSNSIRLSAYDAEKNTFKILFKEKIMAGLAGYVENNRLTLGRGFPVHAKACWNSRSS